MTLIHLQIVGIIAARFHIGAGIVTRLRAWFRSPMIAQLIAADRQGGFREIMQIEFLVRFPITKTL